MDYCWIIVADTCNSLNGRATQAVLSLLHSLKNASPGKILFKEDPVPIVEHKHTVLCLGCPIEEVMSRLLTAGAVHIVCLDDDPEWQKQVYSLRYMHGITVELYSEPLESISTCVLAWRHCLQDGDAPKALKLVSKQHLYPLHDAECIYDESMALCMSIQTTLRRIASYSGTGKCLGTFGGLGAVCRDEENYWKHLIENQGGFLQKEIDSGYLRLQDQQMWANEFIQRLSTPDSDIYHQAPNTGVLFIVFNCPSDSSFMATQIMKVDRNVHFVTSFAFKQSMYVADVKIRTRRGYCEVDKLAQALGYGDGAESPRRIESMCVDANDDCIHLKMRGTQVDLLKLLTRSADLLLL